jgi:hypothetical protein
MSAKEIPSASNAFRAGPSAVVAMSWSERVSVISPFFVVSASLPPAKKTEFEKEMERF